MYFPVLLQYLYQKKPRLPMILQEIRWIVGVTMMSDKVEIKKGSK